MLTNLTSKIINLTSSFLLKISKIIIKKKALLKVAYFSLTKGWKIESHSCSEKEINKKGWHVIYIFFNLFLKEWYWFRGIIKKYYYPSDEFSTLSWIPFPEKKKKKNGEEEQRWNLSWEFESGCRWE